MTSILTNTAAMAALQTLRSVGAQLTQAQSQVSSGLRIQTASDSAAYWSIATTMRSDNGAISAVSDALGLGAAKTDVAYEALDSVVDVMSEFRAKIVAAHEKGVDKQKVQEELDQLKDQLLSISMSASFNGINWLSTGEQKNLWDLSSLPTNIVSSFNRSPDGNVNVGRTQIELADISLFNIGGGALLQKDIRQLGDIGGFRPTDITDSGLSGYNTFSFVPLSQPLGAGDTISFDLLVDDGPWGAGSSHTVTIAKADVDAALGTTNGIIPNASAYANVINYVLVANGIPAAATSASAGTFTIYSTETAGVPGSSIGISAPASSWAPGTNAGGLQNPPASLVNDYAEWTFAFTAPFTLHRDVQFSFDIEINPDPKKTINIPRDFVIGILGSATVSSAVDMALVLDAALVGHGLLVSSTGNNVLFEIDQTLYPDAGTRSIMTIDNVVDNIEPGPDFDIIDVDITDPSADIDNYLFGVNMMLEKAISAASTVGAVKMRIDMQSDFASLLNDSLDKGIGRLVDAEMNEASTRLKALQTQQQLAIQSLQIANSNAENVMALFQ